MALKKYFLYIMKYRFLGILFFFGSWVWVNAQEFENQGDILQFQIDYGYYTPFGDMKDRFGGNFILNSGFEWQHRSNFTFGLHAGILFGNDVKEDVLTNFRTAEGFILGVDNAIADVVLRERGFRINGSVGRVFCLGACTPEIRDQGEPLCWPAAAQHKDSGQHASSTLCTR